MAFINDLLDLLNTYGKFQVTKPDGSVETATELVITENGTRHTVWKAGNNVTYFVDIDVYYTVEVDSGANILNQTPSKDGYTFVGWRRDKVATGTILTNAVMEDDPITLYAVFSKDITLTYYNATSKAATATDKQYYNNGNITNPEFTIEQLEAPTWESRGWATNSKADAAVAYETIREREFSADTTVYALYQRTITLSYDGNGSTSGSTSSQTGIRYWNSAGNYSNPSFVLASNGFGRTNYAFTGWDLGAVNDTVTLSSDTTAYAQWEQTTYYVFQNGTLASGISNNGFTLSGGYLHLGVGADNNDEADASAKIQNVDLTNYSKLDIVVDYQNYVNYGDSSVSYGIDNCWTTALPFTNDGKITTTITIDISSYSGTHYIGFGAWARNDSSEPTWHADANVWVKEIKLYK